MSLLTNAIETYDSMSHIVGNQDETGEVFAPIGFITANGGIEITIDKDGNFIRAGNIDGKILIPVTESSAGRTSGKAAHPLCDKLEYVSDDNKEKHALYIEILEKWAASKYVTPKVTAILKYVKNGTIKDDLENAKAFGVEKNGAPKKADMSVMISWRVEGLGEESGDVSFDRTLQDSYKLFYIEEMKKEAPVVCMATGKEALPATQHIKGISRFSGNAKLVSANDSSNFTYRGRFTAADEAMTMSYEASQKAHNALKWLISNQGVSLGDNNTDRQLICWNPHGIGVPEITSPLRRRNADSKVLPSDYHDALSSVIFGYSKSLPKGENVVVAIFEAATSGRLSILYYNELQASDFLDRLRAWDETCCRYSNKYGTSSPSLYQIVECAYGIQRGSTEDAKLEVNGKIKSKQLQTLISCRIDKRPIPTDIMRSIVQKASNLQILNRKNQMNTLFAACAVVKKYREDRFKEVWKMSLEKDKKDRSYQYGRLLAILEKIERDAIADSETRPTNALRLQAVYVQKPEKTTETLITHLRTSCYPKLSPGSRAYYDKLIGEIIEQISECSDSGKALSETYIMGYYLQNNELYTKKEEDK